MFRRLPHPLLHQLGLHWPSPLLLRALPRPVRQQQPHRALEGHSTLPRFMFCWEYNKVWLDYDFNGGFLFLQGLDIRCFWSWLASGCTTTWSSPGSSFTSSKSSSAFPLGSCHGPHAETGKDTTREKKNAYFESSVGTPTTAWTSTQSPQMVPDKPTTAAQLRRSSSQGKCSSFPQASNR